MPTLARMNTSLPSSANGTSSICMIRSATSAAWMPSPPSSRRIANSSPPSRAAVSAARSTFFSRSPTWSRSPSPAACPRESLIVLKSSMSMNSTATGLRSRSCRSIACNTRSRNSARLARLVTGSWNAWCESCSSNCLRSVMSRVLSTIPRTFGSCSRLVRRVSVAMYVPSDGAGGTRRARVSLAVADRREERQDPRLVVLVDQVDEARALELPGVGAEHPRRRRARVADHGGRLDDGHDVRRVLDERREPRLALTQQQVLGQGRALERERDLRGERPEAVGGGAGISSGVDTIMSPRNSSRMNNGATRTEPSS